MKVWFLLIFSFLLIVLFILIIILLKGNTVFYCRQEFGFQLRANQQGLNISLTSRSHSISSKISVVLSSCSHSIKDFDKMFPFKSVFRFTTSASERTSWPLDWQRDLNLLLASTCTCQAGRMLQRIIRSLPYYKISISININITRRICLEN